jgi:hypothetical protein
LLDVVKNIEDGSYVRYSFINSTTLCPLFLAFATLDDRAVGVPSVSTGYIALVPIILFVVAAASLYYIFFSDNQTTSVEPDCNNSDEPATSPSGGGNGKPPTKLN